MGLLSRRRKRQPVADDQLEVAIVTEPFDGPSVSREIELVRSAMLYADTVELISSTVVMIGAPVSRWTGANSPT